MGKNAPRASGVRALQAIKQSSQAGKAGKVHKQQLENVHLPAGKRAPSPSSLAPHAKRNALGDVTNAAARQYELLGKKEKASLGVGQQVAVSDQPMEDTSKTCVRVEDTPVTSMQNVLKDTRLCDESMRSADMSVSETEEEQPAKASATTTAATTIQQQLWKDIDEAESHDPLFSSEYAPEIYAYMRNREDHFTMKPYLEKQPDISASMRTILVDWLIEVQENFELFHETLYLAVKVVDRYLSTREVKREYLQLVGATSMLIASKFEELCPPLVDDFLYLCDDAYNRDELLGMERDILKAIGYDINIPVAYRFLRRLARAAEATMATHTLARYISESTLQDYQFVHVKASLIAASSLYLSLRMKKLGPWTPTLQHYSGYSVEEMVPCVKQLNAMIANPLPPNVCTVRSKYGHEVFFQVASTSPLASVEDDASTALQECPTINSV